MSDSITLTAEGTHGTATVDIDVAAGCRIAQITVRGQELLIDRAGRGAAPTGWGSFPMAPWAGRVRHGRFGLFGADQQLELNFQDGDAADPDRLHAIHGTVFTRPWIVETLTDDHLTARCTLDDDPSMKAQTGWRFGGTARQTIELMDGQLRCDLSIEVDHDTLMPFLGEVGWHPWFRKPDRLSFHPDAMYERDHIGLPTGRLVAPSDGPWDDCFVNTAPVTLHYDSLNDSPDGDPHDAHGHDISAITLSSDCDHWVVYDEPAAATCVEPQSGPPDAFNIRPRLVTATHPLRRTMNIAW